VRRQGSSPFNNEDRHCDAKFAVTVLGSARSLRLSSLTGDGELMRIPVIQGTIKRRLLINFRADPTVVQRLLPGHLRPKLHAGHAVVGICLIRLEQIRPARLPAAVGIASENAAHRIAVQWTDHYQVEREGVFIPRRDTDSLLNTLAGGRIFPGEHHRAEFTITEQDGSLDLGMRALDGSVSVHVAATEGSAIPTSSCFRSIEESSAFFEGGSLGYSATRSGTRLDGVLLRTLDWRVRPLDVHRVNSSFFSDPSRFPLGSVEFDHGLIMRDVRHEWHAAEDLAMEPVQYVT
jgi:hypothetical protein